MFLKIKKEPNNFLETLSSKQKFWYGTFMWSLLFFAYMVFCLNWLIMSKLEGSSGSSGWSSTFSLSDSKKTLESVNYSLLFARGFAMLWVAWIVTKISHKKSVVIALLLNSISMALPFVPYFWMFIVGRVIMACGGTMSIIFIQPILSRFFNLKQKGIFSLFTSFAYVIGALIANFIFLDKTINTTLVQNWQLVAFITSSLSLIPFYIYWMFGKDFSTTDNYQDEIDQMELPQNTYSGIIKEKSTWFWILWYSFLLVASVSVSNTVPKIVEKVNNSLISGGVGGLEWKSMYTIIFYLGCFFGFFLGRWNNLKFQRKPFVVACCFLGVFFWLVIFLTSIFLKQYSVLFTFIIFWAVFWFAFFAMGVQTVILYIPHEYSENNNAKRVSIFFSYLWGAGYIIYAIYSVIIASIMDFDGGSSTGGSIAAGIFITILISLFGIFSLLIKEPRPQWKKHPWDNRTPEELVASMNDH